MNHIGFCMGEYDTETCSDCLCEADCVRLGYEELVGRIRKEYGLAGADIVNRLSELEKTVKAYRNALVEMGCALSKAEPNISSRSHLDVFWQLME